MKWEKMNVDLKHFTGALQYFPWRNTGLVLRERFREDRLGLTASSLTFTTIIALVPFFTVVLAIFSAFPMFGKLELGVQRWLLESLVPDSISRQVLGYLTQFAGKASRLGFIGLGILLSTALTLILTIDRTLNNIWRVAQVRPFAQRVLTHWATMTLAPLILGASLTATSYAVSATRGFVSALPGGVGVLLSLIEFLLIATGMFALLNTYPTPTSKLTMRGSARFSEPLASLLPNVCSLGIWAVFLPIRSFTVRLPRYPYCYCGSTWSG